MIDLEQKYGKHTALVDAFLTHLKSGNVDWDAAWDAWDAWNAAGDAAGDAWGAARDAARVAARDAAWKAATDAARHVAWDATRDAARHAAWDAAGYAAWEIIGHEILAERGKPLIFLPMFGLDIEQLKELASEQIAESANCPNCEATKQELSDFRQEVSDAVAAFINIRFASRSYDPAKDELKRFIIPTPKPDPLVRVINEVIYAQPHGDIDEVRMAGDFRAALEARGLEIREKNDG